MISSSENRVSYDGDGLAKEFAYQFKILEKSDIKVMLVKPDGSTQILSKDYYVDAEKGVVIYPGYAPGAEIPESERPPVLPTGWRLVLYREVPITQLSKLLEQWPFNIIEDGLDKLTIICQQLKDGLMRSLHIDESHASDVDVTVPWQAGKSFRINDDGKSIVLTEDPARVLPLAQNALEAAQAQAQAAAEYARNADKCMRAAILAQQTAEQYKENAAELAKAAATSEQNANEYQQAANAYKKAAAESEKAAQNYMSAAGQYWQDAQAAASVAQANAQKAVETAAGIQDIADEVAKVHEYLDAAQLAAGNAAASEANALNFAQAAKKMAATASEMSEKATAQATNAEASAQLAQAQAQEANKFATNAADSAAASAQNKADAETAANTATQKAAEIDTLIENAVLNTTGLSVVEGKICVTYSKEV